MPNEVDRLAETDTDHVRGATRGITLLMYGDYECPYTRAAHRNVERLERRLSDELRFIFRHFPLTEIHPHAQRAAEAAEAAHAQDRFWELHDLMFKRQQALAASDLRAYAAEVGLRLEPFDRELADRSHASRVERDVKAGLAAGVEGTPTLFLDGRLHRASYDARELAPLVERLAESKHDASEELR
jgi:protein-disulfide isomerase